MRILELRCVIDRRILVNFHVDPEVLAGALPEPYRPWRVRGTGIVGVCLIRLKRVRPPFVPSALGGNSETAVHRIAVEWEEGGTLKQGVYTPRRDTSSRIDVLLGGRGLPGRRHHARFRVREDLTRYRIEMTSDDRAAHLLLDAEVVDRLPGGSVFRSLREATDFFEVSIPGIAPTTRRGVPGFTSLSPAVWRVQPLAVHRIESSYLEDARYRQGAVAFDSALLIQRRQHRFVEQPALSCESAPAV